MHRVRDGTLSREDFQRRMRPVERAVRAMLWYGGRCSDAKTSGTCRDILKRDQALFTFVHEPGVEPANNIAERSLGHAATWRQGSFAQHGRTVYWRDTGVSSGAGVGRDEEAPEPSCPRLLGGAWNRPGGDPAAQMGTVLA